MCELNEIDPDRNRTSNIQVRPAHDDAHGTIWFILDLLGQRLRQSDSMVLRD
jgi:NADH:ubiquinone oxidoreductase subunit D